MAEDYHRREYEVVVKPSTDPQGVRISMYDVVSTLAAVSYTHLDVYKRQF